MRGVADVLLLGLAHLWEARPQGGGDLGRIVHAQRGLSDQRKFFALRRLHRGHVGNVFDQVDAARELPHGALNFRMALVADHDEFVALFGELGDLDVDLGHQRTGCVEDVETTRTRFYLHGLAHPVRTEHQRRSRRHVGQILDENRAL